MSYDQRNLANTVKPSGWRGTGRIDWCRAWYFNEQLVKMGFRPNPHSWWTGKPGSPDQRCHGCRKTRRELMIPKAPYVAPSGSDAHLERALRSGA